MAREEGLLEIGEHDGGTGNAEVRGGVFFDSEIRDPQTVVKKEKDAGGKMGGDFDEV